MIAKTLGYSFEAEALPLLVGVAMSTNGQINFPTTLLYDAQGRLERVITDATALPH